MIYLDTNVTMWAFLGLNEKLSKKAVHLLETEPLCISPLVLLELKYLNESKKFPNDSDAVLKSLQKQINLKVCNQPFSEIIKSAKQMEWTRDPFDRIITAQAAIDDNILLTADHHIRNHYNNAVW